MKKSICFVVTTPFAVNAFLRTHLISLAKVYRVALCVNTNAYQLAEDIASLVQVHHIDIVRNVSLGQDLRALFQLIWCLFKIRPEAVHSITPKAGLLGMLAAYFALVPRRFHTFTGQVWVNKTGIARFLLKMFDRLIVFYATQIFADSASQCRLLEREGIVGCGKIMIMGQGSLAGVDLSRFYPNDLARKFLRTALGITNDIPIFIFVGRIVRDKGLFDLIEAFALVNDRYPQWELWVVGPNEGGIQNDLKVQSEYLGARVRWFDPTLSPENYMSAADVLVLPSYREGFGSVIIEAAACGIPSIAYRIDGVVDAIVENSTGLLVEKGNVSCLSDSMMYLGSKIDIRKSLAKAAHIRAVNVFSSLSVSAAWVKFYSAALGNTR